MSRTQKVFTSRQNNLDANTYIGEHGRIFYDEPEIPGIPPLLRYSDGVTVGGIPFAVSTTINLTPPPYREASLWWDPNDGNLYIGYNNQWVPAVSATGGGGGGGGSYTLPEATTSTLGGVIIGANISVDSDGIISVAPPPTIPTLVSAFTNDAGYYNASTLPNILGDLTVSGQTITGNVINENIVLSPMGYGQVIVTNLGLNSGTISEQVQVSNGRTELAVLYTLPVSSDNTNTAIPSGTYGNTDPIPAPWTVYTFTTDVSAHIQVGNDVSGLGIPVVPPTSVLFVGSGSFNNVVVANNTFYGSNPLTVPQAGDLVIFTQVSNKYNLSIATNGSTDIALNAGPEGSVVVHSDIVGYNDNQYSLGLNNSRFAELWLGPGTIYLQDGTLNTDQTLSVKDGNLLVRGGTGLTVGEWILENNNIRIIDPTRDITVGSTNATGHVIFNRPIQVETTTGIKTFTVERTGLVRINVPVTMASTDSALNIIGTSNGYQQPRTGGPALLQMTAQDNDSARLSLDSFGTNVYAVIAARTARGSATSPTQTQAGDILMRIASQGWTNAGAFQSNIVRIDQVAAENFTSTATGTKIVFQTTPIGSINAGLSATINSGGLSFIGTPAGTGIIFRDSTVQTTAAVPLTEIGQPNGVASLDNSGLVPLAQLPITGAVVFKGTWDANANSPTLVNGTGTSGWEYVVSTAGTTDFGSGPITFAVGDYVIYNGTSWTKIRSAVGLVSFQGRTAPTAVLLDSDVLGVLQPGDISNSLLAHSSVSVIAGTGLSGGGTVSLGGTITINNAGVTSVSGGTHLSVNNSTGSVLVSTDATDSNTYGTLVARDINGNFSASTITATLTGNASSATKLQTARTINGVNFDGTTNITVPAAAGTLTGQTLNSSVIYSSLTTLGTLASLTVTNNGQFGSVTATQDTSISTNKGAFNYGTLSYSDTGVMADYSSANTSYNQIILQNTSSTASASTNFIVSNDTNVNTTYGEFGMNSSVFSGNTCSFNKAGAVYLAGTNDLVVGTINNNAIHFVINSGTSDAMTITNQGVVSITSTQNATTNGSGALEVAGGASIGKNLIVNGVGYVGATPYTTLLTNPTIVAQAQSGGYYAQVALLNSTSSGSTDFIAYVDTFPGPSSDHGWVDTGMTGSNFSDPSYTITGKQVGYLFASAVSGSNGLGDLVLATDSTGTQNDIIFGTGGFSSSNEKMRLSNSLGQLFIETNTPATSTTSGALRVSGGVGISGDLWVGGTIHGNFSAPTGYTGSMGYTGSAGAQGATGYTGSVGAQGSIGYTGSASTAIGYTGSVGPIGYTGSQASLGKLTVSDQTISGTDVNGNIVLTPNGTGLVSVPGLAVTVGSLVQGTSSIVYNIATLTLASTPTFSDGTNTAIPIGTYGNTNQIPAPWTVYTFTSTPNPALQVDDILGGTGIPLGSQVGFVGSSGYSNIVIVTNFTFNGYNPLIIPGANTLINVARSATNASLEFSTSNNTDIAFYTGSEGNVVTHSDILPYSTDSINLGSPLRRFKQMWMGSGTIYLLDDILQTDIALGSYNGNFYITGTTGLNFGAFTLTGNNIYLSDSTQDLIIGQASDTGSVVFDRAIEVKDVSAQTSFQVSRSGLVTINAPGSLDPTLAAFSIVGSSTRTQQPRNFSGTLFQLTAQDSTPGRLSIDSYGASAYGVLSARTARGSATTPGQTLSGDILSRITAQGWTVTNTTISSYTSKTGSGPYLVTFAIPTQAIAPYLTSAIGGVTYTVSGNSNTSYNASGLTATASTTTSITLSYPTDPGAYGTGTTSLVSTGFFQGSIVRINQNAAQDFTTGGTGTNITFQTTPINSTTIGLSATIDDTGLVLTGTTNSSSGITFRDGSRQTTAATILPSQTGNTGYFLQTNGSTLSWQPVVSGVVYKGNWDPNVNSQGLGNGPPATPSGVQSGWEYSVSASGSFDFGAGSISFNQGDFVIFDGSVWQKIAVASPGVSSITFGSNTLTGPVTVSSTNLTDVLGSGSISNSKLANSSVTITAGTGMSGGGIVSLGSSVTLNNNGVISLVGGTHVNVTGSGGALTVNLDATSANTNSAIVARDVSGNFSANVITAALSGNASTASKLATSRNINGVPFDGSADISIPAGVGYTGSIGPIGYTGSASTVIGYTGSIGSQGPIGYVGSLGYNGSRGYTGSQGIQGVQGPIGYVGSLGYTGSQGIQGIQGPIGYTGSLGYTGSQGIQGVQGPIGYVGSLGYTGSQGIQGIQGPIGYTGSASTVIGYTGSIGSQGPIGYTGSAVINVPGYYYALNAPRSTTPGNANPQSVFGVGVTLAANSRYEFEIQCTVTSSSGNRNPTIAWGGTAITDVAQLSYSAIGYPGALGTVSAMGPAAFLNNYLTSGYTTGVAYVNGGGVTAGTPITTTITGLVDTGTSGGTFYPEIGWSGTPGTVTFSALSYMNISLLGPTGGNSSSGTWS